MTERVSMKEFQGNSGKVFEKVATLGEIILTKRGEDAYIIGKIEAKKAEVATSEVPERTDEMWVKAKREQANINAWRDKAGALDSGGWEAYNRDYDYVGSK